MAGLQEKKLFIGGLDRDSDERFVKEGDYVDSLNVRNQSSDSNSIGVIQNIPGNTKINFNFNQKKLPILYVGDGIFNGNADSGHGGDVPKSVVYFLPDSLPSGSLDFNFDMLGGSYKSSYSSVNLNDVEELKKWMAGFVEKNAVELLSRGVDVKYAEKGISKSSLSLPSLVFLLTNDGDSLNIDIFGADVDNNKVSRNFNFFNKQFNVGR